MIKTTHGVALLAFALMGCASAGYVPGPRPACIQLVVRNDTRTQTNVYVAGTTSSRRRIATVPSLSRETVWLESRDLDADGHFSALVQQMAGADMALSPIAVRCHDGTLHLDVAHLMSTSALYASAR